MTMRKAMTKRLIITYFLMMLLLILLAAIAFVAYNIVLLKTNAKSDLEQFGSKTVNQIDTQISSMDTISIDIATDHAFIQKLNNLESSGAAKQTRANQIKQILIDNYINKSNIYRITAFTAMGDVFSTGVCDLTEKQVRNLVAASGWLTDVDLTNERKSLQVPHKDAWDTSSSEMVISLVRVIKDPAKAKIIGYIEIQQKVDVLEKICENQWNGAQLKMAIIDGNNQTFYSNFDVHNSDLSTVFKNIKEYSSNIIDEKNEILSISGSNYTDWRIALILEKAVLFKSLTYIVWVIAVVVICMVLFSTIFIEIVTRRITNPINSLVKKINKTNLDNLEIQPTESYESYEADVLSNAFFQMKSRLSAAIANERILLDLQTKTTFDMLQSKIGPHFLYNSLGSIANLCQNKETEAAADACYNLSDILRYSANYKQCIVSVADEVENLKAYFLLMKCRYKQRINYTIHMDEKMERITIPKLTLQPIVENAIKYSLIKTEKVYIEVSILVKDEVLRIQISDNGEGISAEKLNQINMSYLDCIKDSKSIDSIGEIQFGGMGLVGTLLRLHFYFGNQFTYLIDSSENGGTTVSFFLKKQIKE
jgi:two-component system, sensor histidine kinase YesM